jgi:hypothetical protein
MTSASTRGPPGVAEATSKAAQRLGGEEEGPHCQEAGPNGESQQDTSPRGRGSEGTSPRSGSGRHDTLGPSK